MNKNDILHDHNSFFGYDWLRGKYLLPGLEKWGQKINGTIIDVGCGTKPYQSLIGKNADKYIGIDQPGSQGEIDIFSEALNLKLPDASVDASFNSWLLDDINEPQKYFKELNRVLKIGGLAIMVESQSFPEHDAPNDYFRFTRHGLTYLAEKNGFTVEEIIPLGGFWVQIGLQPSSFFLRGAAGIIGSWVKIFLIIIHPLFFSLDKINFLPRGTSGHLAVFRKINSL